MIPEAVPSISSDYYGISMYLLSEMLPLLSVSFIIIIVQHLER